MKREQIVTAMIPDRAATADATDSESIDDVSVARSTREIRYRHSSQFVPILAHLDASLLVSTYQAGKLGVIGVRDGRLALSFTSFDRPMGVAVSRDRIAVGTRQQVWRLQNTAGIARLLEPAGAYDGCYVARSCHVTGEIQIHEMAFCGDELWVVNTLFSCLATLDERHSFVPRWRPPFIGALAAEDRCHLNGLAIVDGQPKYVTTLGQTDSPAGWRPQKLDGGCLIDVPSGQIVAAGLAMPHSPRIHDGRLLLLDSGRGRLAQVDPRSGQVETVEQFPGYARGLSCRGQFAFVGLSKIRESSTFGGMPVAEQMESLRCGIAVVDLNSGRTVATFEFETGVEEIFDVAVLPAVRHPAIRGPLGKDDDDSPIWIVPEPG